VKRWLANARGISPRGVEQQAQSRNLNMGLVTKGNNPVRQRGKPTDPATGFLQRTKHPELWRAIFDPVKGREPNVC
jgi:hypothetical protein